MVRRYDAIEFGVSYLLVTNKVNGMYIYYPEDFAHSFVGIKK